MIPPGWIEHDGGPCPLPADVWIDVRFRGEADPAKGALRYYGYSQVFAWNHDGAEDDIMAYCVVETSGLALVEGDQEGEG